MPLFGLGSKFSPKKTPARKNSSNADRTVLDDLVLDHRVVQLKLGEQEITFENGEWMPQTGANGNIHRTNQKLRKRIQELEEENNMLRLKYTVMLNLLTQTTAESHLQEKEIQKLRHRK